MIVRLHEHDEEGETVVRVLERSAAELERAARIGGAVFDVDLGAGPCSRPRQAATDLLALSRSAPDLDADPYAFGAAARARARVTPVPLPTKEG